jgi:hypothetical protein
MEEQLQKLTLAYAPKSLANKPRVIKSDVTREMIDDYEAELSKERIFQPASMIPVLETPTLQPAMTEREKDEVQYILKDRAEQLKEKDDELVYLFNRIRETEDNYNARTSELDLQIQDLKTEIQDKYFNYDVRKQLEQELAYLVKAQRQLGDIFLRTTNAIRDAIAITERDKRALENNASMLQRAYQENDKNIQENAGELERVRKLNQANFKSMEDEIRALNQGFSINQQPNESDEDYLTRIQAMKDTKYSVGTQAEAEVYNYKMLKKKLKDAVNLPDHKLSNVIKMLEKDTLVYEANKKFPIIKTRIEKVLGLGSKPDETTLYNVIYQALTQTELPEEEQVSSVDKQALMRLSVKTLKQLWFETTGIKTPKANGKTLTTKDQIVDELIKLQSLRPDLATVPRISPELSIGLKQKAGEFRKAPLSPIFVPPPPIDTPPKRRGRPAGSKNRTYAEAIAEPVDAPIGAFGVPMVGLRAEKTVGGVPVRKLTKAEQQAVGLKKITEVFKRTGEGLVKLAPFGAIMISPSQLKLYGVLRVREPSKHSIRGMPDVKVSQDMVYILSKIIDGGKPSPTELKALSDNEKSIYDAIIWKAKLHKDVPNNYDTSIATLKRRLQLLEGEVEAGNTNKDLKKEMNSVIRQLIELRAITEQNGRNYLKQL